MSSAFGYIILKKDKKGAIITIMKTRKQSYGSANMVGKNIERIRKERGIKQKDFIARIQTMGCDMNPTSYSKLEGQVRSATDKELFVIAKILNIKMEDLFSEDK